MVIATKIYKKLEECMDNTIKVRDIIEYCESAAESMSRLADKAIKSMGKGETTVSACGAVAYYNPDRESWYVLAWFMTDRYLDSEIDFDRGDKPKIVRLPDEVNDKTHILIAWRSLPEPYRPERSEGE